MSRSIDPIFFDTSYYVAPDGDAGQDVFVVLRDAIRKSARRRFVARRDCPAGTRGRHHSLGKGLVCHTLHEPSDLWDAGPLFADIADIKPEADMVALATQLIDRQNGKFQPEDTQDRYEAKLRDVIDAKLKGEGITPEEPSEPDRGNVIDLMAALEGQPRARKPRRGSAAKAPAAKKSRPASERDDGGVFTQPCRGSVVPWAGNQGDHGYGGIADLKSLFWRPMAWSRSN